VRWRGKEWSGRKLARGEAPGRFSILIDNKSIKGIFGTVGENWHWQKGPVVKLKKGTFKLALKDLAGFDGRCDAILFSRDIETPPPNVDPEMRKWGLGSDHDNSFTGKTLTTVYPLNSGLRAIF